MMHTETLLSLALVCSCPLAAVAAATNAAVLIDDALNGRTAGRVDGTPARPAESATGGTVSPADVYRAELTGDAADWERALAGLQAFQEFFSQQAAAGRTPGSDSFFRAHGVLYTLYRVHAAGRLTAVLKHAYEPIARALVGLNERGNNNRPTLWAAAAASAARVYPNVPEAARWRAYAEAVWQDWLLVKDTHEFGYWHHHLGGLLDLADALGKTNELQASGLAQTPRRYRDLVAPSGRAVTAGDGALMHFSMPMVFARWARILDDPTLAWAADKTLAASRREGRSEAAALASVIARLGPSPQPPEFKPAVLRRYEETPITAPDVLLLRPRAAIGPFATFNVSDQENLMQHGHPRQKGELLHLEVQGATLLRHLAYGVRDEGGANTFLMAEPGGEFPMRMASPVTSGLWYRGSVSLARSTWCRPAAEYRQIEASSPESIELLLGPGDGLGYFLYNPRNYFGAGREFRLGRIELRFLRTVPGQPMSAWVARELQMLNADPAPSAGLLRARVTNFRLVGPKGILPLPQWKAVDESVSLAQLPPDEPAQHHSHTPPVETRHLLDRAARLQRLRVVPAADGIPPALEVDCEPGTTVLTLAGFDLPVDAFNGYTRLEFDYRFEGDTRRWRLIPIFAFLDGVSEGNRVDREPGGILINAEVGDRDGDSWGEFTFRDFFTADTRWTRRMLLTREGILVVRDDIDPGPQAHGFLAGPVWQLPAPPTSGLNWFSAPATWPENTGVPPHLLVYFDGPQGVQAGLRRCGVQYLPFAIPYPHGLGGGRVRAPDTYAVHASSPLCEGQPERFLSVLVAHAGNRPAADLARTISAETTSGGETRVSVDGLAIHLSAAGAWRVGPR